MSAMSVESPTAVLSEQLPMNTVVTGEPGLVFARFSPGGDRLLLATLRGGEEDA